MLELIIFVAAVALAIWAARLKPDRKTTSRVRHRTTQARPLQSPIGDSDEIDYNIEVVGESKYQRTIQAIAGPRSHEGHEIHTQATLVPEPNNRYDENAICVKIDGKRVGYLDRETAIEWRDHLAAQGLPIATYRAPAVIRGGWDRGGNDQGHFGIRLRLPLDD